MKVYSYVISMADEVDVLPDALDSLSQVSDRIFVVDGGMVNKLSHHPRYKQPLSEWFPSCSQFHGWLHASDEEHEGLWRGIPLTLYNHDFKSDPGYQRNWITQKMESLPNQPDWYLWIDSDEVLSDQLIEAIRHRLPQIPMGITNICPKWLGLVQDEEHCVPHMSQNLSHARLYRPGTIYWNNGWHENQNYSGARELWEERVVHTRALFRRRLYVQRGHPTVASRPSPLWADCQMVSIPEGVTWKLHWPDGESPIPFDVDIRIFEGGIYARLPES